MVGVFLWARYPCTTVGFSDEGDGGVEFVEGFPEGSQQEIHQVLPRLLQSVLGIRSCDAVPRLYCDGYLDYKKQRPLGTLQKDYA